MFRNLMAMDTEEMIRAQPMDAVVLLGGCDKTVPAQLMGAISAGRPAIQVVAGPMLTSRHRGERLGACTDCRRFWGRFRAGEIEEDEIEAVEERLATTAGTCGVMGTASTMAAIAETLGMMLPGTAAIPAVHADRLRAAEASGASAVEMGRKGLTPDRIITPESIENALRVMLAIGGSTNAIIHLTAIAGRAGIDVDLRRLNQLSDATPVLVDLKPTGPHYMEDLFAAGGIGAVLRELRSLLHLGCATVTGDISRGPAGWRRRICRQERHPLALRAGAGAGWSGGAVRLAGAARRHPQALGGEPGALRTRGTRPGVLLSRGSGGAHRRSRARCPCRRHPGAEERRPDQPLGHARGRLPADSRQARPLRRARHAAHLGRADERHRFRHRGAPRRPRRRRSGGPLAAVRTGDRIRISVAERRLDLLVPEAELAGRSPERFASPERGYARLYRQEVLQADLGSADLDFLRHTPTRGGRRS